MSEQMRAPERIEQDIRATRAEIDETLDALQSKLSPGKLLDRALGYAKGGGGEFAANLGRSVRHNPVPLLLTGAGIAWLMMAGRARPAQDERAEAPAVDYRAFGEGQSASDYPGDTGRSGAASPTSVAGPVEGSADEPRSGKRKAEAWRASGEAKAKAAGEGLSGAARRAQRRAGEIGEAAQERAAELRGRAGDYAERARARTARAKSAANRLWVENPLAVGALGLALGAVLAAALPQTRREDELLGAGSDRLKRGVKEAGREGVETAKEVAKSAVEGGKAEAERQNLMPEAAKRETGQAAQSGAEAATAAGQSGTTAAKKA